MKGWATEPYRRVYHNHRSSVLLRITTMYRIYPFILRFSKHETFRGALDFNIYTVSELTRRSATGNCKWRTWPSRPIGIELTTLRTEGTESRFGLIFSILTWSWSTVDSCLAHNRNYDYYNLTHLLFASSALATTWWKDAINSKEFS